MFTNTFGENVSKVCMNAVTKYKNVCFIRHININNHDHFRFMYYISLIQVYKNCKKYHH